LTAEAPLTPPEADLTGYAFMPLFGEQLFGSDFNLEASDAEFRAALRIWWAAWTQVPAASLPNDEKKLCQLAGLGRDGHGEVEEDARARHAQLRAVLGRALYHRVLAPTPSRHGRSARPPSSAARRAGLPGALRRG
jgi:hypothetical protein